MRPKLLPCPKKSTERLLVTFNPFFGRTKFFEMLQHMVSIRWKKLMALVADKQRTLRFFVPGVAVVTEQAPDKPDIFWRKLEVLLQWWQAEVQRRQQLLLVL